MGQVFWKPAVRSYLFPQICWWKCLLKLHTA
jgi:hypothetical protein